MLETCTGVGPCQVPPRRAGGHCPGDSGGQGRNSRAALAARPTRAAWAASRAAAGALRGGGDSWGLGRPWGAGGGSGPRRPARPAHLLGDPGLQLPADVAPGHAVQVVQLPEQQQRPALRVRVPGARLELQPHVRHLPARAPRPLRSGAAPARPRRRPGLPGRRPRLPPSPGQLARRAGPARGARGRRAGGGRGAGQSERAPRAALPCRPQAGRPHTPAGPARVGGRGPPSRGRPGLRPAPQVRKPLSRQAFPEAALTPDTAGGPETPGGLQPWGVPWNRPWPDLNSSPGSSRQTRVSTHPKQQDPHPTPPHVRPD